VSATGEQPTVERPVSNSTPVALGLAIAALVGVLGAGIAWGDARSRLSNVEDWKREAAGRLQRAEDASTAHAATDAAVQAEVRGIKESVGDLKGGVADLNRKMDRLLERRGVTRAGGPE
jgi:hypothetical protein